MKIESHALCSRHVKVLLVEDDPVTRLLVRKALRDECVLVTAEHAEKAISAYQAYKPDIVFLDIGLPDRDGRYVLEHLLMMDKNAYIVMFSGAATKENIGESIGAGAKGFICKPFHKVDLMKHVSYHL